MAAISARTSVAAVWAAVSVSSRSRSPASTEAGSLTWPTLCARTASALMC